MNKRSALVILATILALLGARTMIRNAEWVDPIPFLDANRQAFPNDADLLNRLGAQYAAQGNNRDALRLLRQAREHEGETNAYYRQQVMLADAIDLASVYMATHRYWDAWMEGKRAVAAKPDDYLAWQQLFLGSLLYGDKPLADKALRRFNELAPPDLIKKPEAPLVPFHVRDRPYFLFGFLLLLWLTFTPKGFYGRTGNLERDAGRSDGAGDRVSSVG